MLVFLSLVLLVFHFRVSGYNFDTNFPIIYFDPLEPAAADKSLNKSSYFGYSVALLGVSKPGGPW